MLTLANISSQQAKNYYQKENCSHPDVAQHFSEWWGRGAEQLQLQGAIQNLIAYENLIDGFNPDGKKRLRQKHSSSRAGYDLTFSAPKSISLAALVGEQFALEQAHRQAVRKVMAFIEDHHVVTRIRGQRQPTDNLIVAMWHHDSSRELDPHLHTHCVVMNATQSQDGKWRALTNEAFYYQKMRLGKRYRQELAFACQQLGYSIEPHPKELFEIKGYTREQLEIFSKRHQQILDKLEVMGKAATTENKIWAWHRTRAKKQQTIGRVEKVQQWQAEAAFYEIKHPVPTTEAIATVDFQQSQSQPASDLQLLAAPTNTQREDAMLPARAGEAIAQAKPIHHLTEIPEMSVRAAHIAQDYLALSPAARQQSLIVANTNEERLAIMAEVRQGLKAEGRLGKSTVITQLKAKNLSIVQASLPHSYQVGDVVIPTRHYRKQGLQKAQPYWVTAVASDHLQLKDKYGNSFPVNPMKFRKMVYTQHSMEVSVGDRLRWTENRSDQIFTVTAIEGNTAHLQDDRGKTKAISLEEPLPLDLAWVSAINSFPPQSAETVLMAADKETLNQEDFYTVISRIKTKVHLYVQNQGQLLEQGQARWGEDPPFALVQAPSPEVTQQEIQQPTQPIETPLSPQQLWQQYSVQAPARSAVALTKQVAMQAFRDGYSQETVLQILAHDPHFQSVQQQQGEAKARQYRQQMLRSAHHQVFVHSSRRQEAHQQPEQNLTL